jgi:hypothetical protein
LEISLKRTALAILAMMFSRVAVAEDFDPEKFGLVAKNQNKENYCIFLRDAVEGRKKVWKCTDGSMRYGDTNIWGKDGVPRQPEPPEDMAIKIREGMLLTVEVVADKEECYRSGRHSHCERYSVPNFSYLMTEDKVQCEHMAPRLAARQYIVYRDLGIPTKITFKCEGAWKAGSKFLMQRTPGMPSLMGVPLGL